MTASTTAPPDLVREELARLMNSEALRRAPSHARLLRYLVEHRVAGDESALRETSIALDVFRRDPSTYDPRTDPIVRVTIGRLRDRLSAHYARFDTPPKLRIVLPKGSYAPDFVPERGAIAPAAGIAILPARNLTGNAAHDAIAAEFTERLTDGIARAGVPRVIAHASVLQASSTSGDPRALSRRLGVAWLVDSTLVREARGGLRLSVRLLGGDADVRWVETAVSSHIEADSLVVRMHDLVTLRLLETLPGGARERAPASTAAPPFDQRTLLERSRLLLLQRTIPATDEAIVLAERVTRAHPGSADAWASLAAAALSRTTFYDRDPAPLAPRVHDAARRAEKLDPEHPMALRTLAILAGKHDHDFEGARSLFERALAAMPNYTSARINYAELLTLAGHPAESRTQLGLARFHDPLSTSVHLAQAVCATLERRFGDADEAWALCRAAGEASAWLLSGEALTALAAGRIDQAAARARAFARKMPDEPTALLCLGAVAAARGDSARADELDLACQDRFPWFPASNRALPYALRRDRGAVLDLLATAIERREPTLIAATMHPAFDWLDGDTAYERLRRRVPIWAGRRP